METDFDNLIRLQELDRELNHIYLFLEDIPRHINEIEKKWEESDLIISRAKDSLTQNQKQRRDLESEAQDIKEKITKYKLQRNQVKTNKEYRSLEKEIEEAESRIDILEETIISKMLAADDIEKEIKESSQKASAIQNELSKEKESVLQKKKEWEEQKKSLLDAREELLPEIPRDMLNLYTNISRKKGGTALSPVTNEFCSMCHMRIRPQVLNELKERTEIILCENCGRILYWPLSTE